MTEQIRSIDGSGLYGLEGGHSILDHERELAGVDTMGANARVRSEGHFDPGAHGFAEVAPLGLGQIAIVLQEIRRRFPR